MSSRKRERQLAAARELERRRQSAAATSPLSREQLDDLWLHVANFVAEYGHDGEWTQTRNWLETHGLPVDAAIEFLALHRMNNDFDVLLTCDPNALFGVAGGRFKRMPIDRAELVALLKYLEQQLPETGCDHSTKQTENWLAERNLPAIPTVMACLALGGGCDCEIVMNVEPDNIYYSHE